MVMAMVIVTFFFCSSGHVDGDGEFLHAGEGIWILVALE